MSNHPEKESRPESESCISDLASTIDEENYPNGETRRRPQIAAQETSRGALWPKILLVVGIFVAAGAGLGIATYLPISNQEQKNFESNFQTLAKEIISQSQQNAEHVMKIAETLSVDITSHVAFANGKWPFVVVPDMEAKASRIVSVTGATTVFYTPIVVQGDKDAWETYSVNHRDWIDENVADFSFRIYYRDTTTKQKVFPTNSPGPFLPVWQGAPAKTIQVNQDVYSKYFIGKATQQILQKLPRPVAFTKASAASGGKGASWIALPIFDIINDDNESSNVVAILFMRIPWRMYFTNILPSTTADPVHVVFQDACSGTTTFLVNGPEATEVGKGDFHNRKYDSLRVSADFLSAASLEGCPMSLDIYPTEVFEDSEKSNTAALVTGIVLGIFVFVSYGVFAVYNYCGKRRV